MLEERKVNARIETPAAVAKHFAACGDSVDLINAGQPVDMTDEEWVDVLARNKEHLTLMLAKDYWTTENIGAIKAASV